MTISRGRRSFIGAALGAVSVAAFGRLAQAKPSSEAAPELAREHAIVERLLVVYEEAARRLETAADVAPEIVTRAARVARGWLEEHHEREEEDVVFPQLVMRGDAHAVTMLREQHEAARRTTRVIVGASAGSFATASDRARVAASLRSFARIYRAHAQHESALLVSTAIEVPRSPFDAEREEHAIAELAAIERQLGV